MRFVIPGGTGQVGTVLARAFLRDGHDVTILSRRPHSPSSAAVPRLPHARVLPWNARSINAALVEALDGADVVINLVGRSVDCRYSANNRREIMQSRVDSARAIGKAIAQCTHAPDVWMQASTATIYAHRLETPNDEHTGVIGGDEPDAPSTWRFSIDVARAWEQAALEASLSSTRRVIMRSAMIMSPDRGGIFDTLRRLAQFGLGGSAAGGRQYVSWIHETDFVNGIYWLLDHEDLAGPVNLSSPNPLPYTQFMRELRRAVHMPIGLPATRWMLEIGAFVLRTETELVLKSRRVVPTRLLESGFVFAYPGWRDAVQELVSRRQEHARTT